MNSVAPTAPARPGLAHLGLLYTTPDDLLESALPRVKQALAAGDAVSTFVDRRTARELRAALGDRAARVEFASPVGHERDHPDGFLRRLRELVAPGRRALVLAQYSAFGLSAAELTLGEDAINLTLDDLPLTMVCACDRSGGELADAALHRHPLLVGRRDAVDNPAYRRPDDRSPTPSATWGGRHTLRLLFRDSRDLAGIRDRVGSCANDCGLRGDDHAAAVLAVHEAAVLACETAHRTDPAPCALDVWQGPGRFAVEVHHPHHDDPPSAADGDRATDDTVVAHGAGAPADEGTSTGSVRIADPLRYVRALVPDVVTYATAAVRTTRVALHATPAG